MGKHGKKLIAAMLAVSLVLAMPLATVYAEGPELSEDPEITEEPVATETSEEVLSEETEDPPASCEESADPVEQQQSDTETPEDPEIPQEDAGDISDSLYKEPARDGESGYVTVDNTYGSGIYAGSSFLVQYNSYTYVGVCCEHGNLAQSGEVWISEYSGTAQQISDAKKLAYYYENLANTDDLKRKTILSMSQVYTGYGWGQGAGQGYFDFNPNQFIESVRNTVTDAQIATVKLYVATLKSGDATGQRVMFWQMASPGTLTLKKTSSQEGLYLVATCPNNYSLSGAIYGVYRTEYDALSGQNAAATLTTDATGNSNTVSLNPGTYYVKEVSPSRGFCLDKNTYTVSIQSGGTASVTSVEPFGDPVWQILEKTDALDKRYPEVDLSGAVFEVSYFDVTSERAIEGSDPVFTWYMKTYVTASGKFYADLQNENSLFQDDTVTLNDGTVLTGDPYFRTASGELTVPNGFIQIREIQAPEGYLLSKDVFVREVDWTVSGAVIYNAPVIPNMEIPELHTTALDGLTGTHTGVIGDEVTIVDTVEYSNLIPGLEYTLKGMLMTGTGEPLLIEGEVVTSELTFIPEEPTGRVDMIFTFSSSTLAGQDTVVFEELYLDNDLIGEHKDENDEGQTVSYPDIHTTALNDATGDHTGETAGTIRITDTIAYKNLTPGEKYYAVGTIIDKETGEPLKENGKEVTGRSGIFTPDTPDGTVSVTFTFHSSALRDNAEIVVYEKLYSENDTEITSHEDITDEGQTIRFRTTPGTWTVTVKGGGFPKTGDELGMLTWVAVFLAAVILLTGPMAYGKRRETRKKGDVK